MAKSKGQAASLRDRLEHAGVSLALALLARLPFRRRVRVAGWLMSRLIAPLTDMRQRIAANLDLVRPDLAPAERARLLREVPDNLGRLFVELFSPRDLADLAARTPIGGAGLPALDAAQAQGRPVIAVSGHLGNYDIVRAALIRRGFSVGGLYRPMNNPLFNTRYEAAIRQLGEPLFPRGKQGLTGMVRHLKAGGLLALLTDQHMRHGARLRFFGQPAATALSAAQLALKYDALLVPVYGLRQPDGTSFRIEVEAPIPHSNDVTMTQALNDSLEAQVRAHMGQWLWTHRRWKTGRRRAR